MSASTFIITMCLPAPIVLSATIAPAFGLPVASITTSTSGARHTRSGVETAAIRPRAMARDTSAADFTVSGLRHRAPAISQPAAIRSGFESQ